MSNIPKDFPPYDSDSKLSLCKSFPQFGNITANLSVIIDEQLLYMNLHEGIAGFDPQPADRWLFNGDGINSILLNIDNFRFFAIRNSIGASTILLSSTFFFDFACIENSFRISTPDRSYLLVKPFNNNYLVTLTEDVQDATIFTAENIS